jgi:hypothetical protein
VPITHKQSAEHTHTELEGEELDHVNIPWSSALVTLVLAEVSQAHHASPKRPIAQFLYEKVCPRDRHIIPPNESLG